MGLENEKLGLSMMFDKPAEAMMAYPLPAQELNAAHHDNCPPSILLKRAPTLSKLILL